MAFSSSVLISAPTTGFLYSSYPSVPHFFSSLRDHPYAFTNHLHPFWSCVSRVPPPTPQGWDGVVEVGHHFPRVPTHSQTTPDTSAWMLKFSSLWTTSVPELIFKSAGFFFLFFESASFISSILIIYFEMIEQIFIKRRLGSVWI